MIVLIRGRVEETLNIIFRTTVLYFFSFIQSAIVKLDDYNLQENRLYKG